MNARAFIVSLLLLAFAFGGCSKDETVAPSGSFDGTWRESGASFAPDAGTAQRDPATAGLRDGDPTEGGGTDEGGGISDDGDDESDSEQNKKTGH